MCELYLDSREGGAYKRTKAPRFGPRGGGEGGRERGGSRRLLHPSKWIYLGDLVLRNKDTYIGDVVTMGGERVGGGGAASSALVHRVNPVEGAEWVLIIDWFPVA